MSFRIKVTLTFFIILYPNRINSDPDELSNLLTEEQYDAYLVEEGMTDEDGNPIKDEAN